MLTYPEKTAIINQHILDKTALRLFMFYHELSSIEIQANKYNHYNVFLHYPFTRTIETTTVVIDFLYEQINDYRHKKCLAKDLTIL